MPILLIRQLVQNGIITDLVARDAQVSVESGEVLTFDEALEKRGVSPEMLRQMRSQVYGIPEYTTPVALNQTLAGYIGEEMAKQYMILPIAYTDKLVVGVVDPESNGVLDTLQDSLGKKGTPYALTLITHDQFMKGFSEYYTMGSVVANAVATPDKKFVLSDVASVSANIGKEEYIDLTNERGELTEGIEKLPVEQIVKKILRYAIDNNASDIHIEPMEDSVRIRTRVDGVLSLVTTFPVSIGRSLVARFKILSDMKLDEKRKPQDGRFSTRFENHKVDYRVSVLPNYFGEKVVIRILDSYRGVKPLHELGFSEAHLAEIRKALERPYGLILISGPTGSGKTTTLYSMLSELDRKSRNVVSLEDPIEFNVSDMIQSQIFPEIGYTFASGLRSILRQDPDVIMVGEIRDGETAALAIQAALTGHLVFSTIHTNNSIGIVSRLKDMGIDPYLIAPTLCMIIAQRLVHRIAPSSVSPLEQDPAREAFVQEMFEGVPEEVKKDLDLDRPLNEAVPSATAPTGLKGRIPVVEVVTVNDELQDAILADKTEDEMWAIAQANGAISMKQDAVLKCMDGSVPFVEINSL